MLTNTLKHLRAGHDSEVKSTLRFVPWREGYHMNIGEFGLIQPEGRWRKIPVVTGLLALTALVYYVVPIHLTVVQGLLTRFFYLPIFLGGLWFGIRGGAGVALLATIGLISNRNINGKKSNDLPFI